jgi:prepilin-type N-terminal cleavage/methylation domain-containing protein
MKKGFSMVELAIVLVVIGIIMGMALKGGQIVEAAKIRREARKLERFEIAVAVAVQKLGPKGTVGELEIYGNNVNYLSEDYFKNNNLLTVDDYETYTTPQSSDPQGRKRIYNSRLSNSGGVGNIDAADGRGDPGATLVLRGSPFLICQLESMLDDLDKVTGQGAINVLTFTGTDGNAYGYAQLSNADDAALNYYCILKWSHGYNIADNYGEYFWRLL